MEIWSKFGPLIIFENSKPCGTSILIRPTSPQCSVALPTAKTAVLGSIKRSLFPRRRFLRFNESRSGLLLLSTFASPFCLIPPSLTPPPSSSKLASLASKPVADFLGARWSQQGKQGISHLVAFMRLKPDVATKLVSLSGSKGLFISRVDPKNPCVEKPFWVPRNASESDETYHRRVCSLQVQRQQPVIHRFGKNGETLGFLRRPDDPEVDNRIRALTISSVPRAWGSDDLSTFLAGVGWTNLVHLTRRGKRWYGRAKPPDDHFRQSSWQYQVQLSDAQPAWSIHVQVSVPGPRQLPVS